MTMRCERCGQYGIRWVGWRMNNFTHTECPHCGGTNCQEPPEPECTCGSETDEHDADCLLMD